MIPRISPGIVYRGPALDSRKRYYWKCRVWDGAGQSSGIAPAWWEMGLLRPMTEARWIRWKNREDDAPRRNAMNLVPGQNALQVAPKSASTFRASVELPTSNGGRSVACDARGFSSQGHGNEVDAKKPVDPAFDRRDISDELVVGKNIVEITVTAPPAAGLDPSRGHDYDGCADCLW